MKINPDVIRNLQIDAGTARTEKAKDYYEKGKVKIVKATYENDKNFSVRAVVRGSMPYRTYVEIGDGEIQDVTCTCEDYYNHYSVCKHTLASVLALLDWEEEEKEEKVISPNRAFKQIITTFYNEEVEAIDDNPILLKEKGKIRIEPKIIYDRFANTMKAEFKIGNKRMYKIKDLSQFYTAMLNHELYRYGDKLQFVHTKEMFVQEDQKLLEFILKYAELIKYANSNSNSNYRYYGKALNESSIVIGNTGIDELYEILEGKQVAFQKDALPLKVTFMQAEPNVEFYLKKLGKKQYHIVANEDIFKISILKGKNYKYLLEEDKLYRCSKIFENTTLRLLELFRQNYMTELTLGEEELYSFFSIMMPKLKNVIKIEGIEEKDLEKYQPKELGVKVFLDFDENNNVVAEVRFCYDMIEINPLDEKVKVDFPRNQIQETRALNAFRKTGFMFDVQNLRFILPDEDKIYAFLTEDINYYMQKFEVLVTDNFKAKQIRQPKVGTLGVKVENNLLEIDLKGLDIDVEELKDIMEKYHLKKKYYRLKDGSFLNLENNKEIDFMDKLISGMQLSYDEIAEGEVYLPTYRTMYLNQLLKGMKGTQVIKNEGYKEVVNELDKERIEEDAKVPASLEPILRYYQKTGFKWLKVLDNYRFGGILADDMGLGKTIQMLSVLLDYIENTKENRRASLVICPSSLSLNWQNEAQKFASNMKTLVIKGSLEERKKQIAKIPEYDLVITSYDLLKRDIDIYLEKDYTFRYMIADEAQYLKNSNTQNAKSIKKLKSDTKYALTGTPIENSLAELWSIFDYIMPGYLFSYKNFKTMYETPIVKNEDTKAMEKLKMLIEPFILRRNKKEVLTELPDKTITVLNNEMGEEQRKLYLSYLAQAKQEVAEQIDTNGFEKSHIQILAALTRLRQICCHPGLFIQDYHDGSSKLEQCIEIMEDAIQSGHKILLFSGYTAMFPFIEELLQEKKITYFKLTGATKVDERITLVEEFNQNPEIKVFLISLKAGGTGLNLTGADMVIHYDPWWNLSTENQATDRAYRIGQKNNVQVYKLITKNSIEEKIYELQQKKAELVDNMLSTKQSFINKLSKDEIMRLFE